MPPCGITAPIRAPPPPPSVPAPPRLLLLPLASPLAWWWGCTPTWAGGLRGAQSSAQGALPATHSYTMQPRE